MANFFGRKDSIWGGETIDCKQTNTVLGLKAGDKFRVEKSTGKLTLIPHPNNLGTWNQVHSKTNPINIKPKKVTPTDYERAYAMMVTIKSGAQPTKLFLVETAFGDLAIVNMATHPRGGGGSEETASVER